MALTKTQKQSIEKTITDSLRNKFQNHNPEPAVMPFHTHLLGGDRLALYSFIHSLNTNFGTTIFEPVAVALASPRFKVANHSVKTGRTLSSGSQQVIEEIMTSLENADAEPDKEAEVERIRAVCRSGNPIKVKPTKQDVFLESHEGEIYLIDIKSPKPNTGEFAGFKRTLLKWCAVYLYEYPKASVHGIIAMPYNPYEPNPYKRWTARGMMDLDKELLVAEEFWDFLGGDGTYTDLLGCFERAGVTMRKEIDDYFDRFNI